MAAEEHTRSAKTLAPMILTPHLNRWTIGLGGIFRLKLDNDEFGGVSKPQGRSVVKPNHIVPCRPPTAMQPQPVLPFWILHPPLSQGDL